MERKILFRGKCVPESKYAGEWVEGGCVQCENGETLIIYAQSDHCTSTYHVIPDSVGQYTGMHDVHGKDIFEGDIVQSSRFIKHVIFYDEKLGSFVALCDGKLDLASRFDQNWLDTYGKEIVGNVHDNPELIIN